MMACKPIETSAGRIIDCACRNYQQEGIYSHPLGARTAYLTHVAQQVMVDQRWDGTAEVEIDA